MILINNSLIITKNKSETQIVSNEYLTEVIENYDNDKEPSKIGGVWNTPQF